MCNSLDDRSPEINSDPDDFQSLEEYERSPESSRSVRMEDMGNLEVNPPRPGEPSPSDDEDDVNLENFRVEFGGGAQEQPDPDSPTLVSDVEDNNEEEEPDEEVTSNLYLSVGTDDNVEREGDQNLDRNENVGEDEQEPPVVPEEEDMDKDDYEEDEDEGTSSSSVPFHGGSFRSESLLETKDLEVDDFNLEPDQNEDDEKNKENEQQGEDEMPEKEEGQEGEGEEEDEGDQESQEQEKEDQEDNEEEQDEEMEEGEDDTDRDDEGEEEEESDEEKPAEEEDEEPVVRSELREEDRERETETRTDRETDDNLTSRSTGRKRGRPRFEREDTGRSQPDPSRDASGEMRVGSSRTEPERQRSFREQPRDTSASSEVPVKYKKYMTPGAVIYNYQKGRLTKREALEILHEIKQSRMLHKSADKVYIDKEGDVRLPKGYSFGRSRTEDGKVKRKRGLTRIDREIQAYQKTTHMLIPRAIFARIVREIAQGWFKGEGQIKFTVEALAALQTAAEDEMVRLLETSMVCSRHAKRITLRVEDVRLARFCRGRQLYEFSNMDM